MRPPGSPETLERRRSKAVVLLHEGYAPVEVAKRLGVDRRSVRRWKAAFRRSGRLGIAAQPASGRPPKLDGKARRRLEQVLLRGALAAGFPTDLWTCRRVAEVTARRFAVHCHLSHIGRVLRSLGWSPQRPQRRAIERDETAIQRWVQQEWPRVKKSPSVEGASGLPGRNGDSPGPVGAANVGAVWRNASVLPAHPLPPEGVGRWRLGRESGPEPRAVLLPLPSECQRRDQTGDRLPPASFQAGSRPNRVAVGSLPPSPVQGHAPLPPSASFDPAGVLSALCAGTESDRRRLGISEDEFAGQLASRGTGRSRPACPPSWPLRTAQGTPPESLHQTLAPSFAPNVGHYL
jgi:transposase